MGTGVVFSSSPGEKNSSVVGKYTDPSARLPCLTPKLPTGQVSSLFYSSAVNGGMMWEVSYSCCKD